MDKKEIGNKINELLGVEYDWTKPLKKEELEELLSMLESFKEFMETGEMDLKSFVKIARGAVKKEAVKRVENVVDKVLSGKGPIVSIFIQSDKSEDE